jgi:diaminohydroxyphosphoribosylaminopyrimidine deaminase/5-amino-6-(5-phosphoribosylamino)uracil reductase
MLENGLIDELVFFVAPKLIGGNGFAPFTLSAMTRMEQAYKLIFTDVRRSGVDLLIHARPEVSCSPV